MPSYSLGLTFNSVLALADKENLTEKQATEIIKLIFNGLTDTTDVPAATNIKEWANRERLAQ